MEPKQFLDELLAAVPTTVDFQVNLGGCRVRLAGDRVGRTVQRFSNPVTGSSDPVDFELWCLSCPPTGFTTEDLRRWVDGSKRAASFAKGYYATDHFGPPVLLVTDGWRYVLFGEDLELVVWSYFVKYFLLRYSIDQSMLFLKGAAVSYGASCTLLLGRGGGGKTTLAAELARSGASFVTNSHALVAGNQLYGVATTMRVRKGELDAQELVDPVTAIACVDYGPVPVDTICVVCYSGRRNCLTVELSREDAFAIAQQFALGLNVYRLEEDLLDFCAGSYPTFAQHYQAMLDQLGRLVSGARCFLVDAEATLPTTTSKLRKLFDYR